MTHPKLATARSGYGGRGYYIPGEVDEDGKRAVFPSITTVLKQVAKPGVTQWVADQTAAFAVANIPILMERSEETGWGFLRFFWNREPAEGDDLRNYHDGVLNDAAELGTNVHEYIEADLGGTATYPVPLGPKVDEMLDVWEEWKLSHDVQMLKSEFTVFNPDWGVAGTGDGYWIIECLHDEPCLGTPGPHRVLVDVKTSRNTWPEHGMQVACLASAPRVMVEVAEGDGDSHEATVDGVKQKSWWIQEDAPQYDCAALLHIRPNDLDSQGNDIPAFCKLKLVEDLDLYAQGFLGAMNLCRMNFELKQRERSRRNGKT